MLPWPAVLLLQLKDDAVALVDVLAPTDFILNSPIGNADGQVGLESPWIVSVLVSFLFFDDFRSHSCVFIFSIKKSCFHPKNVFNKKKKKTLNWNYSSNSKKTVMQPGQFYNYALILTYLVTWPAAGGQRVVRQEPMVTTRGNHPLEPTSKSVCLSNLPSIVWEGLVNLTELFIFNVKNRTGLNS